MEKANNAYHLGLDLSEYAKARIRAVMAQQPQRSFHDTHVPTCQCSFSGSFESIAFDLHKDDV